jgi:zinc protease
MKKSEVLLLSLLLAAVLFDAPAMGAAVSIPVERYSLANGLKVVLSPNDSSPTIAVAVYYNVGSKVEEKGKSGFAHLFEHMMFQGSENVPKTGHFKIISSHGGTFNGSTGEDYTTYYEELPAQMLPVALWLEADRMRSLKITEENFENQRSVVIEEKLENYDNEPYVPSFLEINRLAYEGWWPYEHPVIGDINDLKGAKLEWVRDFFATYYNPSNAVLVIAGDFRPEDAKKLVKEYFDDIPGSGAAASFKPHPFKPAGSEKFKIMYDALAPLPALHIAYNIPPMRSPAYYPLRLVAMALGDGESSRFYQKFVKEQQSVQEMDVGIDGRKEPDLFSIFMVLSGTQSPGEVRKGIDAEIAAIAAEGLPEEELSKVKTRITMKYVSNLDNNLSTAIMLGKYELLWGDASLVNSEVERFTAVTPQDIVAAAKKYLVKERRTVLDVLPSQGSAEEEN